MPFAPAQRSDISPFRVMDVMTQAAACEERGDHVLHLEVGQPGTKAPRLALEAVNSAIETDVLGYTLPFGIAPLEAIAAQDMLGVAAHALDVNVAHGLLNLVALGRDVVLMSNANLEELLILVDEFRGRSLGEK